MATFKLIFFDWDGTLLDSMATKMANAAAVFSERLGAQPGIVVSSYRRHSGIPRRELFEQISIDCCGNGLDEGQYVALSTAFTQANLKSLPLSCRLRPGAVATLNDLRSAGKFLCVSSSASPEELNALTAELGIDALVDEVMGSRTGFSKGAEHVKYISQKFGVDVPQMVAVGDDTHDMDLFRSAGVTPIGITGTTSRENLLAAGAAGVIDSLSELSMYVR